MAAQDGEWVGSYGILGMAHGVKIPIQISYPPENGANNVDDTIQYSGTFPSAPEASWAAKGTIKVKENVKF